MSLTQCKQCDEWCKGEFCSEECKKQWQAGT